MVYKSVPDDIKRKKCMKKELNAKILAALLVIVLASFAGFGQTVTPNYVETVVKQFDPYGVVVPDLISREYRDGLDRSIQMKSKINTKANPASSVTSVVSSSVYDPAGRPWLSYKPFASSGDVLNYDDAAISTLFSEVNYYDDPLSRVKEKSAPGDVFKIGTNSATNHTARYWYFGTQPGYDIYDAYGFIIASEFSASRSGLIQFLDIDISSHLPPNPTRFLTVVLDENNHITQIVKDIFGRTMATWATKDLSNSIVSNNEYDILGNLLAEYPPTENVVNPLSLITSTYNTLGQLLTKTVSDIGGVGENVRDSFAYDSVGHLAATFRLKDKYGAATIISKTEIFYDWLDRVVIESNTDGYLNSPSSHPETSILYNWYDGLKNYSLTGYSDFTNRILDLLNLSKQEKDMLIGDLMSDDNARGKLIATYCVNKVPPTENMQGKYYVADFFVYDEEGRTRIHYRALPSTPLQKFSYGFDFTGRIAFDTLSTVISSRVRNYSYDNNGKLLKATDASIDGIWHGKDLVSYSYDDLGKTSSKHFYNNGQTETHYDVNLVYDVSRDWLTGIQAGTSDDNKFKEEIGYTTNAGLECPTNVEDQTQYKQYNGNICQVNLYYQNRHGIELTYLYDALNRLTNTIAQEIPRPISLAPIVADNYNEIFQYDDVGRFTSKWVRKYGADGIGTRSYNYYSNSSRLKNVDNYHSSSINYLYDYYGNMVYDASKKMAVLYNWRNLPVLFSFYSQPLSSDTLSDHAGGAFNGCIDPFALSNCCSKLAMVSKVMMLYDASGNRVTKMEKKMQ